jgi:methylenetetrahydrofolate reductase (NADPH)
LNGRLERMSKFGPAFVTVTWGAGGSTATKSLDLAETCQQDLGLCTCLHLTCTNMDQKILDDALEHAKKLGIRNILALRGDPPRADEYDVSMNGAKDFNYAIDLIKYIKSKYGDEFCIGVAAYPEGHVDGVDDSDQNPDHDIPFLIEKVKAGADFIITQLFYDADTFIQFEKVLHEHPSGVFKNTPLIPGLMPINTYQSFIRAAKLSHASIPDHIMKSLSAIPTGDDEQVKQYGVQMMCDMIERIRSETNGRVRGFHFYTLNLERAIALILEKSGLLMPHHHHHEDSAIASDDEDETLRRHPQARKHRKSSASSTLNKVIVDNNLNDPEDQIFDRLVGHQSVESLRDTALAISTGEGDLGREALWDDFPNGRFGNAKSPAYGEIDGYGPTLHVEKNRALKIWGYPVDAKDISTLFVKHITDELEALPWSEEKLSPETSLIQEELIQVNQRGMWTLASQPSGNCVKSTDKIFGWGPPGGHIFQKAFVEFFISHEDWLKLKQRLEKEDIENISYYEGTSATNKIQSNLPSGSSNAVTWAVFPNREVVQSTIVEEESFNAWRDEAFNIWKEWQRLYHPSSPTYKLLDNIYKTYHLVSVTHHDFFNNHALWDFLLD